MTQAVILGASGRLGRALVPLFSAAGFDVIAVARTPTVVHGSDNTRWIPADLTIEEDRTRVATTVDTWTPRHGHVCVVDAVLDRSGVDAMRRSVQGGTETVLRLRDRLGDRAHGWELTAASTTAVLAPGLYQTPYGLAKRRQVLTYARSGVRGTALLLPSLASALAPQPGAWTARRAGWFYEQASQHLVAMALATPSRPGFVIHVPDLAAASTGTATAALSAAGTAVLAHLRSLVLDRDCMQAHRDAARSRLLLTPNRIRRRVDHHRAPAELVRRFADRQQVAVAWQRPSASSPTGAVRA